MLLRRVKRLVRDFIGGTCVEPSLFRQLDPAEKLDVRTVVEFRRMTCRRVADQEADRAAVVDPEPFGPELVNHDRFAACTSRRRLRPLPLTPK